MLDHLAGSMDVPVLVNNLSELVANSLDMTSKAELEAPEELIGSCRVFSALLVDGEHDGLDGSRMAARL